MYTALTNTEKSMYVFLIDIIIKNIPSDLILLFQFFDQIWFTQERFSQEKLKLFVMMINFAQIT